MHLATFHKVFGETKLVSDILQASSLDISKAVFSRSFSSDFRQELFFDDICDEVLNISGQCDGTQPAAKRPKC